MQMDDIAAFFTDALPGLTDEKMDEVKEALTIHGFHELQHLAYLAYLAYLSYLQPEADLKDVLNTLQLGILKTKLTEKAAMESSHCGKMVCNIIFVRPLFKSEGICYFVCL